jgi:hypothetical protein
MIKRRFEIAAGVSATAVVLGLTLVDAGNQPPKPPNDSAKVQALARYIITHGKAEALPKSVNGSRDYALEDQDGALWLRFSVQTAEASKNTTVVTDIDVQAALPAQGRVLNLSIDPVKESPSNRTWSASCTQGATTQQELNQQVVLPPNLRGYSSTPQASRILEHTIHEAQWLLFDRSSIGQTALQGPGRSICSPN